MQGEIGTALFRRHGLNPTDPDTILVIDGDKVLRDSDAVISIYTALGGPWRTAAYRWVARNRYRIFGKRDTCWYPTLKIPIACCDIA